MANRLLKAVRGEEGGEDDAGGFRPISRDAG
jgi:hypothetical protein